MVDHRKCFQLLLGEGGSSVIEREHAALERGIGATLLWDNLDIGGIDPLGFETGADPFEIRHLRWVPAEDVDILGREPDGADTGIYNGSKW